MIIKILTFCYRSLFGCLFLCNHSLFSMGEWFRYYWTLESWMPACLPACLYHLLKWQAKCWNLKVMYWKIVENDIQNTTEKTITKKKKKQKQRKKIRKFKWRNVSKLVIGYIFFLIFLLKFPLFWLTEGNVCVRCF